MTQESKNVYLQIAGKIGGASVFLAAAVLIFGGNSGDAIGGVAILCAFGVVMAAFNRSRDCECCDASVEDTSSKKKSSKKSKKR